MKEILQKHKCEHPLSWALLKMFKLWRIFVASLVAYIVVYIVLTTKGSYQPAVIGLNGIKSYEWAPLGFYTDNHQQNFNGPKENGNWNGIMLRSFFPLWYIDIHFSHKVSFDGKSPASP